MNSSSLPLMTLLFLAAVSLATSAPTPSGWQTGPQYYYQSMQNVPMQNAPMQGGGTSFNYSGGNMPVTYPNQQYSQSHNIANQQHLQNYMTMAMAMMSNSQMQNQAHPMYDHPLSPHAQAYHTSNVTSDQQHNQTPSVNSRDGSLLSRAPSMMSDTKSDYSHSSSLSPSHKSVMSNWSDQRSSIIGSQSDTNSLSSLFPKFPIQSDKTVPEGFDEDALAVNARKMSNDEDGWPKGLPKLGQEGESGEFMPFRMQDGRRYLCYLPKAHTETKKQEKKVGETWRTDLVEEGLGMLEPLVGNCLKFVEGWWTYEYCHRQHVRQYHETSTPKERGFDVLLGREEGDDRTSMHDEPDHPVPDTSLILGSDAFRGSRQMLLRRYTGGSECELTGRPRTVEVEYRCSPIGDERITGVKEVSTCMYRMTIQTYKMCGNPEFSGAAYSPILDASCYSVVEEDVYIDWVKGQAGAGKGTGEGKGAGDRERLEKDWPTLDGEGKAKIGDPRGEALREQLAKGEKAKPKGDSMWKLLEDMAESLSGKFKEDGKAKEGGRVKEDENNKEDGREGKEEWVKKTKEAPREYTAEELEGMSPEELKQVILNQQKSKKNKGTKIILAGGVPVNGEGAAMAIDLADLLGGGSGDGGTTGAKDKNREEGGNGAEELQEQEKQLQELLDSVLGGLNGKEDKPRKRTKSQDKKGDGLARDEL
ncbi:hypothetical protein BJ684DRAFT_19814 [Piptocephalis cylindrospora]|uniref:Protein OS-9 homolog n=1 Tax=Piptocephalis cylindrospora TaxID=1907219 RepID=A0A4P9Y433_9FUNG|nr:hypothetical protein BJ684DRAFT_19814 [Piptocephalis cylindrospora]|eukprot:RKP13728.1 hypothetical protein BJ684DRAFT_19814 [Piptocephalis cylindrospora]